MDCGTLQIQTSILTLNNKGDNANIKPIIPFYYEQHNCQTDIRQACNKNNLTFSESSSLSQHRQVTKKLKHICISTDSNLKRLHLRINYMYKYTIHNIFGLYQTKSRQTIIHNSPYYTKVQSNLTPQQHCRFVDNKITCGSFDIRQVNSQRQAGFLFQQCSNQARNWCSKHIFLFSKTSSQGTTFCYSYCQT